MKEYLTPQEEEELDHMMSVGKEMGFEEAQWRYEQIPVPECLDDMVRRIVCEQSEQKERRARRAAWKRSVRITMRTVGSMAAAILLFMIPLNTSEAFARQMQQIPVFGRLAEVLTIRSYSYEENDVNVNVQVPEIVAVGWQENEAECCDSMEGEVECYDYGAALSAEVNEQIQTIVETYEVDAKQRFAEYKEAFFANGGTQEEWDGRTCDVIVDYVVTYNAEDTLSLILTTSESWVAVYGEKYYYNLDLESGEYLTLYDLLGENWINICNESIDAQIEERLASDTEQMLCYWGYGEDEAEGFAEKFTTVNEETVFYINAQGNPVVCFEKYEIAPGYMGVQEFEISR